MASRTRTFRPQMEILEDRTVPSAGALDPSFGALGLVTTRDETHTFESPNSARAIQVDGKIVVAGESAKFAQNVLGVEGPPDFAVARYNLDGTLDTSFGDKGWITVDFGASRDVATAVAVQPDGRIVLAGYSNANAVDPSADSGYEFAVIRLNSNGSLDTSFSGDGKQTVDFGIGEDVAQAMALRSDGKIVVSGNRFIENLGYGFEVVQLNTDGSLDTSFSDDGKQFVDFGTIYDFNTDMALQPDGKIVLGGTTFNFRSTGYDFAVARLNPDGSFDTSFSGDGLQSIDLAGTADFGTAVAVQPDGKIVVSGNSSPFDPFGGDSGGIEFAVARLNADGSLDTSFDGDGWQTIDFGGWGAEFGIMDEDAQDLVLQPDGKIVVAGTTFGADTGFDFAVARLNADGSLDNSFDGDGRQTFDFGVAFSSSADFGRGVALQPDGKIVVAGSAKVFDVDIDFALARLNADGSVDHTFGEDGLLHTDFPRRAGTGMLKSVAIQEDGKIVAAGMLEGGAGETVRYNPDGTIDTTFGAGGIVTGTPFRFLEVQRDGKIVLAGDTSIIRLNANGSLDTTFGIGGAQTYDFHIEGFALAPNGKMALVGPAPNPIPPPGPPPPTPPSSPPSPAPILIQVARLNQNGSLDTTFDGDGKQTIDVSGTFSFGGSWAVAIEPNGEMVVAVVNSDPSDLAYLMARLKKDGRLDTSFDGDGKQIIKLEGRNKALSGHWSGVRMDLAGMALESNGKIVVAGSSSPSDPALSGASDDFTVFRLNKDGILDSSFDGDGWQTIDFDGRIDVAFSMALQSDGKIVVVGTSEGGGLFDFAVARLNNDGRLDNSFDVDGKEIIDFGLANDFAFDVALQRDGKIVVAGTAGDLEDSTHFALARLAGKDDKKSPTISINDVEQLEGHSGTTPFTFTVSLSHRSNETVTVKYQALSGSAVARDFFDPPDYKEASGTLTFAPGETTKTVTVLVYGDRDGEVNGSHLDEGFQTFSVQLINATNAAIADDRGIGTIVDDDPRISISDVTQTEGPEGQTTLFTFTVTFSAAFDHPVTIGYFTTDDTTQAGEDYAAQEGALTFAPGETSKTITIVVTGDGTREADETFLVPLLGDESIFRSFVKGFGVGTILNDD